MPVVLIVRSLVIVSMLLSIAASNVAIVVASKASILLKVAVPEESVRISVPLIEIPLPVKRSIPSSRKATIFEPSTVNWNFPRSTSVSAVLVANDATCISWVPDW